MEYITIFWTSLMLLVSSSGFSDAVLPEHFQNPVEVQEIHVTRNFYIPDDPAASLPDHYSINADRGRIYMCNETRLQSFAVVRDNEDVPILIFYSQQMQFDVTFANHIKFDVVIAHDRILTLFCTFPTVDSAKTFFRLVRGNASDYLPQDFLVFAIETYDEEEDLREPLIPQPTLLRQNFIHNRTAADAVRFELRWERVDDPHQPISVEFTQRDFYISNVINGKIALTVGEEEETFYILYFILPTVARQFFDYIRQFARGTLRISPRFRNMLNTTQRMV